MEVTHLDNVKPQRYARLGVREMWRATGERESDRFRVEILALQETGGPKIVEISRVLPGLPARILPQAFELAEFGKYQPLGDLVIENSVQVGTPELAKGGEEPPTPPSLGPGIYCMPRVPRSQSVKIIIANPPLSALILMVNGKDTENAPINSRKKEGNRGHLPQAQG